MPIIPLLTQSQPLPNLPDAVLNHERRPTADNRGVLQAIGQLADAQKQPLMDARAMAAPYEALADVGYAIARTGSVLGALASKVREAQVDKQISDGDEAYDGALAQHEKWKVETGADPSTWEGDIVARLGKIRESYAERKDLHPEALEQINLRANRFEGIAKARVMEAAAKATFGQVRSIALSKMERATQAGNKEQYVADRNEALAKGRIYPHEAEQADERYGQVARARWDERTQTIQQNAQTLSEAGELDGALQQYDLLATEKRMPVRDVETLKLGARRFHEGLTWVQRIKADPLEARNELAGLLDAEGRVAGGSNLTTEQVSKLQEQSAVATNQKRLKLFSSALEQIDAGHLLDNDALKKHGAGYFSETDVKRLTRARMSIAGPTPEERTDLANDIKKYDPAQDAGQGELTEIQSRIAIMPVGFREQFNAQLDSATRPDGALSTAIQDQIHVSMELGVFGNVQTFDGKPVNPTSYQDAHRKAADLQYSFYHWTKEHPKATMEEAQQWVLDQTRPTSLAAAVTATKPRSFSFWDWARGKDPVRGPAPAPASAPHETQLEAEARKTRERRDAIIAGGRRLPQPSTAATQDGH